MQHNKDYFPKEIQDYLDSFEERKWLRRFHNIIWFHTWFDPLLHQDDNYAYTLVRCACGNINATVVQKLPDDIIEKSFNELIE